MAQVGLGVFTKKSTKMVLIGSNHRLETEPHRSSVFYSYKGACYIRVTSRTNNRLSPPSSLPFYQFATNEAIQRTEAYEYAQSLGSQPCSLPNFQVDVYIMLGKHLVLSGGVLKSSALTPQTTEEMLSR